MPLIEAENKFLEIIRNLSDEDDKIKFLQWIDENWKIGDLPVIKREEIRILNQIADELREILPQDAIMPTEHIIMPLHGPNADCNSSTTVHLDEFLYNDEYVDNLVDDGKMSRHYCGDCYSKNIKPLTFITHSMSADRIEFLFKALLPPIDDKIILDVGSRLGAVLYGACLFTKSNKIIGVEINNEFCKLQNDVIKKFGFVNRINVICDSIFNQLEMLATADVIILNNIFEFFADKDTTVASWKQLAENIKEEAIIVTIPHLETTFSELSVGFDWQEWVEELPLHNEKGVNGDIEIHLEQMKHYRVKQKLSRIS